MKNSRKKVINLLLVDDHPVVREGIKASLKRKRHVRIVGEASDGEEAISMARKLEPDVILMDISMPRMTGIEAAKRLRKSAPGAKILVLTMHDNKEYVLKMAQLGARGYVFKDASPSELLHAIEAVDAGEIMFAPQASRLILAEYAETAGRSGRNVASDLSDRERLVLRLIAEGYMTKQIADRLSLSHKTVETYRHRIMVKLNFHSIADLTKYAVATGLVEPK
jgi:DNA-binding NarL/FixJ family response regulator